MNRKILRNLLPTLRLTAGMLAHIDIAGKDDSSEVMPAAQLWKRQDLLDRSVVWHRIDKDEFKRPRLILLLGSQRKARKEP